MIGVITILFASVWSIRIIANTLSFIHLWYIKEYRSDRMWIHWKITPVTKLLFPPFRMPPITPKTRMLSMMSLISVGLILLILPGHLLIRIIVLDLLAFPITALWVIIFNVPTGIYHKIIIYLAVKKLRKHSPMRVIGVTGSFGKTSTKENLATILSTSYKVIKTEESKNSPIGVAEVILRKLTPDHEIFIVEMGAYKQGEIEQMAKMVKPQVGIITGINPQHQDLFKTLETTKRAKYELIQNLPKGGIAVFNADNEGVLELAHLAQSEGRSVWVYSKNIKKRQSGHDKFIYAENIKVSLKDITFTVIIGKEKVMLVVPILGAHQVDNILAAIAGAVALGMKLEDIAKGAQKIRPFTKTMEPVTGLNGSLFINDTLNNNPDAAKAALDYLALTKGKKILVFQPMIELGDYAQISHEEVGAYAARICDMILLTNHNWIESFKKGVRKVDPKKNSQVVSPKEGAKIIRSTIGQGDTVVFKGKEAENVLSELR